MNVWGLTGGIGMGKTTAAHKLRELGVKVVDTDALARAVVEPGQPALNEIQAAFGLSVIGSDGHLRREELAKRVFADSSARGVLEGILHLRIRGLWIQQVEDWRQAGEELAVVAIPLLFETHAESHFNKIICCACLPITQQERLRARGWSATHLRQRLAAQWSSEAKVARSNYVLWTEGTLESLSRQVERILPKKS